MSGNESSDDMEELRALMSLYGNQAEEGEEVDEVPPETPNEARKSRKRKVEPSYVEVPMEKVVFGDKRTLLTNLAKAVGQKPIENNVEPSDDNSEDDGDTEKKKAAWTDSDDEDIKVGDVRRPKRHTGPLNHLRKDKPYKEYLTNRLKNSVKQPEWATLSRKKGRDESDDSEDEQLLKTVGFIDHKAKAYQLRPTTLDFKRLKDLNRSNYRERSISSIQFHPSSTAALVAGQNSTATIYAVDGEQNEELHSIHLRNFPITCARITPCGTKAFFGSFEKFYFAYDLLEGSATKLSLYRPVRSFHQFEVSPCGKYLAAAGEFGALHIFTTNSNELLTSFKLETIVRGMCFTADSQRLLCNGSGHKVNILSIRQNRIEHSFIDDGCINGQALHLAPNQRLLATGSNEGVVNVYDYESVNNTETPQPVHTFMNLRTPITEVRFNHSSELLGMCSNKVPDAVKLAHFPSATVYSNFANFQPHLDKVTTLAFSPSSAFLALGNVQRKVPLFRLKYFKNY